MTRYERRVFFERLIELQTAYRARGAEDRTPAITIEDAIQEAEAAFAALRAADETALPGIPAVRATTGDLDESGKPR
jgi:hypothetical protein